MDTECDYCGLEFIKQTVQFLDFSYLLYLLNYVKES